MRKAGNLGYGLRRDNEKGGNLGCGLRRDKEKGRNGYKDKREKEVKIN